MMKQIIILGIALIYIFGGENAFAFSITVDGLLDEWGPSPDFYATSVWTPYAGIFYNVEDTPPSQNEVGPGYGYQVYDVEAIYATYDAQNFYYAIVTGFPPGGIGEHIPGDIAFDFDKDGSYEYGISCLTRNGFSVGQLYDVSVWNNGLYGWKDANSNPTYMHTAGSISTIGDFIYTDGHYNGNHYVIEGYLQHDAFVSDWGKDFTMHWAMSCGNDYLNVDVDYVVPEPATMSLLGIGLLGLAGIKRKRS